MTCNGDCKRCFNAVKKEYIDCAAKRSITCGGDCARCFHSYNKLTVFKCGSNPNKMMKYDYERIEHVRV